MKQYLQLLARTQLLSLGLAAALLSGCGGGSSSGSTSSETTGGTVRPRPDLGSRGGGSPAPTSQDFLTSSLFSRPDGSQTLLVVVDPTQPDSPRYSLELGSRPEVKFSDAIVRNKLTGGARHLGTSRLYYIKDRKLFQLSLRKADQTVPKRISSLATACSFGHLDVLPTQSGQEWLELTDAGPDGDCTTSVDNRQVYVRSSSSSDTVATVLPERVQLISVLPNEDHSAAKFFLALDRTGTQGKLTLYGPLLTPVGDVINGGGIDDFAGLSVLAGRHRTQFVAADSTLRRLNWDDSGATLSATVLHNYVQASSNHTTHQLSDGSDFYFMDGHSIYRVLVDGPAVLLGKVDGAVDPLRLATLVGSTQGHLLIAKFEGSGTSRLTHLYSLSKSGGALTPLASEPGLQTLGSVADTLVYQYPTSTSEAKPAYAIRQVKLDGGAKTVLNIEPSGRVTRVVDNDESDSPQTISALRGLIWCESAPDAPDCRTGMLKMHDLRGSTVTTFGRFVAEGVETGWDPLAHAPSYVFVDAPLFLLGPSRSPSTGNGTEAPQYFFVRPWEAGSLMRVPA